MCTDGFRVVPGHRAIIDTLRLVPEAHARQVLFRVLHLRWICAREIEDAVVDLRTCDGLTQLRALSQEAARGSHAESESLFHRLLAKHQIRGWIANHPITDTLGVIGVIDVAFPSAKVAVEIDGRAWHTDRERFQRDRTRQNRLVLAGWTILRFTWDDVVNMPSETIATLKAALVLAPTGWPHTAVQIVQNSTNPYRSVEVALV